MNRFLLGVGATLCLGAGGLFLWQSQAERDALIPDAPPPPEIAEPLVLPEPEADAPESGEAPPEVARKRLTAEQKRFNRYDMDRDERITRIEMMSTRTRAFKELDTDGNNLLSFEEWAVKTSDRFAGADADGDGRLTRGEFATTRRKTKPKPKKPECRC